VVPSALVAVSPDRQIIVAHMLANFRFSNPIQII
jgi:hypothetical protein